jgi:ElaB/YqjD/DUF883 family membrane-anchored ribosome-binding protein
MGSFVSPRLSSESPGRQIMRSLFSKVRSIGRAEEDNLRPRGALPLHRSHIGCRQRKGQPSEAMKNQLDLSTQTPEEILNELKAVVIEAEKILGNDTTGARSEGTVAALKERLEAAQERLGQFYVGARQKVVRGAKRTDEAIRDNPYQSLAVALGVGLLAGAVLGRYTKRSS